jgi:DNA-directed RNA polymerase subunit RPC12/RpoP
MAKRDQVRLMTDTRVNYEKPERCPYCGYYRVSFNSYIGKYKCLNCDKYIPVNHKDQIKLESDTETKES